MAEIRRVWLKQGVMGRLTREAQRGLGKAVSLYYSHGLDFFITSIEEATHMPGSFHYTGDAFDCLKLSILLSDLKKALGPGFDVLEYTEVYHVEYDPKKER